MDPHELGCLAAVHAGVQHECFQCFQKLFPFIFAGFLKRLQQFDIILFDESSLDLDVDAVAHQGQFIFGKNPFVREDILHERPAFADEPVCVSRTFDPVETGHMEDPRALVSLEPVEELHAAVLQIGPGHLIFIGQDHAVGLVSFGDLHDVQIFLLLKFREDLTLHFGADPLGKEYAEDIVSADARLVLEGVGQTFVASHKRFNKLCFRIPFRGVFPHAHGQLDDLRQLGNLACRIGIFVIDDEHVVFFVVDGHRAPVGQDAVDVDHGVGLGLVFHIPLLAQLDGVGDGRLVTGLHRQDRVEVLAEDD